MNTEFDTRDIDLLIAQARRARSDAMGEFLATGTRRAVAWIASALDRALHAFLMSPTAPRS